MTRAELRALLAAATGGRWYLVPVNGHPHLRNMGSTQPSGGLDFTSVASMLSDVPTAEAIVALRNHAEGLLDALDAAERERDEAREDWDRLRRERDRALTAARDLREALALLAVMERKPKDLRRALSLIDSHAWLTDGGDGK
jgi:cell division protein FtsL